MLSVKMATDWHDLASQQAELISNRLRELLSSGLNFLNTEFGVELGLRPELYPSWVILSTAFIVLFVVALSWVAACGAVFSGRKRGAVASESIDSSDSPKAPLTKILKTDEQKKKNKKKPVDKKAQPNGRTVPEPQEELKVSEEILKPRPEIKADKGKKNKKKPKPEVKQTKTVSSPDGREPDDGAWETKVSNREKRQQRRKEKGPGDGSGSPEGVDRSSHQVEPPMVTAPVGPRKSRETPHAKVGKGDAIKAQAPTNWNDVPSLNGGGWSDMSMKLTSHMSTSDIEKWPAVMTTSGHRNPEALAWGQESEGSWTGGGGRMKPEHNPVNFTMLGLKPSGSEPVPQPAPDLQWDSLASVDPEWSGFNGLAADPSSDWSAPTELWGNYEEPLVEAPAPPKAPASKPAGLQDSDDDKEKGDASGSGKSKKKKKKKKKPEEGAAAQVSTERSVAPQETHVPLEEPAPVTSTTKQNVPPPSSQKKSEPPKQVQKKKARRET